MKKKHAAPNKETREIDLEDGPMPQPTERDLPAKKSRPDASSKKKKITKSKRK